MRGGALVAIGVASGLMLAGCAPDDATDASPQQNEVRHDLGPLTARFPAIGVPVRASWVGWNSATGGIPGPTTYWIDAVIVLAPSTTATLVAQHHPREQGGRPSVQQALGSEVPAGPFLTSASLDDALSTSGWRSAAFLDEDAGVLVVSSMDD